MIAKSSPTPYRFVIETILFLTYAVFGLSWIAITPLLNEIQAAFHIGNAQLGLLNTMVAVAKAIAPLLTGLLVLRLGIKKTIMIGSACIAVSVVTPWAPNFQIFLGER